MVFACRLMPLKTQKRTVLMYSASHLPANNDVWIGSLDVNRLSSLPASIGLCLSGGGFRAAAFHLGTLHYLNRVRLLDRVQRLSTVSGGTFVGTKYTLSRVQNQSFEAFLHLFTMNCEQAASSPTLWRSWRA